MVAVLATTTTAITRVFPEGIESRFLSIMLHCLLFSIAFVQCVSVDDMMKRTGGGVTVFGWQSDTILA